MDGNIKYLKNYFIVDHEIKYVCYYSICYGNCIITLDFNKICLICNDSVLYIDIDLKIFRDIFKF